MGLRYIFSVQMKKQHQLNLYYFNRTYTYCILVSQPKIQSSVVSICNYPHVVLTKKKMISNVVLSESTLWLGLNQLWFRNA